MTDLQIRTARVQDYRQVMALLRQLNSQDAETPLVFAAFETILETDNLVLLVAERGGVVLATCYLNIIPNLTRDGRPYAVIENVVTDAGHRKQGIGSALIEAAVALAWDANCYKIMLMSGRASGTVRAFYERCGFDADDKQAHMRRAT